MTMKNGFSTQTFSLSLSSFFFLTRRLTLAFSIHPMDCPTSALSTESGAFFFFVCVNFRALGHRTTEKRRKKKDV
ncbi:hypothetical protein BDB00DRAFT_824854, partial [Zychaea mexicana]|uniref:uncharacterized protein n=1 Tax=Zychaea mexicana TaxID=64656 RepID=UPI0022FE76B9